MSNNSEHFSPADTPLRRKEIEDGYIYREYHGKTWGNMLWCANCRSYQTDSYTGIMPKHKCDKAVCNCKWPEETPKPCPVHRYLSSYPNNLKDY